MEAAAIEHERASPAEATPGKSQVLYHPEDRAQIDELVKKLRNEP